MTDEYIGKNSAFTATADAIREKGESTESIVWNEETGFEQAVLAIKGGVDLNFEVVGGASQPSDPVENTIWVNTETEITGWFFSIDEPTNPADGFVWIKTGHVGTAQFNALKKDGITVYPTFSKQYVNGAWDDKDAKIYQDGEWNDWMFYLYKYGNQYENVTGGWKKLYTPSGWWYEGSVSFTDSGIVLNNSTGQMQSAAITNNKINLTGVDRVLLKHTLDSGDIDLRLYIVNDTAYTDSPVAKGTMIASGIIDVPVSSLSGEYYIKTELVHNTKKSQHTVKEVYLIYETDIS